VVDLHRDVLEPIADRVVRDRGEVDDHIRAVDHVVGQIPKVHEVLRVQQMLRRGVDAGQAVREVAGVDTCDPRVRSCPAQLSCHARSDISKISSDENFHLSTIP
jgi:hypothetical protein